MAKKISVSFKKKEYFIHSYLMKQFNPNYYIKTLIYEDMQKNKENKEQTIETNKSNFDFDF
ncbi:UNVERIFIED_ORG: hypothetical protein B2H93_14695 [Clostridium botulinum]